MTLPDCAEVFISVFYKIHKARALWILICSNYSLRRVESFPRLGDLIRQLDVSLPPPV